MGADLSKGVEPAIFRPPNPPSYSADRLPEHFVWIPVGSERRIAAVWHTWASTTAYASDSGAYFTVLLSHDYAEDLGTISQDLLLLRETLRVNVLAYDYAGYGLSQDAPPSEAACYADIGAAFEWLTTVKAVPASRVILVGRTLGSGPTLHLAAQLAAAHADGAPAAASLSGGGGFFSKLLSAGARSGPAAALAGPRLLAGVVLLSPMTSALGLLGGPGGAAALRGSPASPLVTTGAVPAGAADVFDNAKRVDKCPAPLLLAHPVADELVPLAHAHRLAKRAGSRLWRLQELRDAAHADAPRSDDYLSAFLEFARALAPPEAHVPSGPAPPPAAFSSSPSFVVQDWLRQCAEVPAAYAEHFLAEGYYDLASIAAIREADPVIQRVENPVHRQRLLDAIARLAGPASTVSPRGPAVPPATSAHPRPVSPFAARFGLSKGAPQPLKAQQDDKKRGVLSSAAAPAPGSAKKAAKSGRTPPGRSDDSGAAGAAPAPAPSPFPGIPLRAAERATSPTRAARLDPGAPSEPPPAPAPAPAAPRGKDDPGARLPSPRTPFTLNTQAPPQPASSSAKPPAADRGAAGPSSPKGAAAVLLSYGASSKKIERPPRVIKADADGVARAERPYPRAANAAAADAARLERVRVQLAELGPAAAAGDERARAVLERVAALLDDPDRDHAGSDQARRRFEENLSKFKGAEGPAPAPAPVPSGPAAAPSAAASRPGPPERHKSAEQTPTIVTPAAAAAAAAAGTVPLSSSPSPSPSLVSTAHPASAPTSTPLKPQPPPGPAPRRVGAAEVLALSRQLAEDLKLDVAVASALTMTVALRALQQDQRSSFALAAAAPPPDPASATDGPAPSASASGARSIELQLSVDMAGQLEAQLKHNRELLSRFLADCERLCRPLV